MSDPTTAFDDELLSAYIDGALADAEQAHLSALVQREPVAARALAEFQYTRRMLASAPRLPVPRAFTLSEAMVGSTSRPRIGWLAWLQPAYLRGAVAVVAICLLLLLAGDVGTRAGLLPGVQPAGVTVEQGGLAPNQGDPTGVIAKAPTTDPEAGPAGFLGLPPNALLAVEAGLAVLLVVLLVVGWQLRRTGSSGWV